ncbi:MAG TPA: hypothetical protein VKS22_00400 [Candidatus Binataceae bacterium]|nr:hypothetical protein [Candidatus Binataceae bacterium]
MNFCTRCGSRMAGLEICRVCGARPYRTERRLSATEYPPAGDLPSFTFKYNVALLGLVEREQQVSVPFSYINGLLVDVRTHEDPANAVHTKLWQQQDDPNSGPRGPIVGRESQPSIRNIVRLRLGNGAERSFVLTQVRLRTKVGSRVTLIFPVSIERAINPVYDYAAIAAVEYAANHFTWSTTHPEIHAIRSRLPEDQAEPFADSLAGYLNGLCRRCLRLFGMHGRVAERRYQAGARHGELMR